MMDLITTGGRQLTEPDTAAYDFTEAWLANRRFAGNTRDAYRRDIHQWLDWCALHQLDPLQVTFLEVNAWGRSMEVAADGRKALAPASIARKMSAVSSWYGFIAKLGRIPANPAAVADRPPVDRDFSPTTSFSDKDAARMLAAADPDDPYLGAAAPVLAAWLVELGTRATETTDLDIDSLGNHEGFRTVDLILKGGRRKRRAIPPPLAALVEQYLTDRAQRAGCEVQDLQGPLFVNARGQRLDRHDLARFVRRLARTARVENADRITPHSFRHAWNSMARGAGASLEERQDAMGHRDPRTTRRYDRHSDNLIRDPALLVAAAVAARREQHGQV